MASLVLGAVGSYFGGPIGYMIGSALGAALFPPPGQDGPRLSDLKVQNSTYGATIPVVYGTYRVAGNVIWSAPLVEHAHETDSGSGGGGITTYTYTCSFAVSLCEGPIAGVRRIWADGKLIYDITPGVASSVLFTATSHKLYLGDETQLPDPTIEAGKGIGNVPAYRGQAYWVFTDLELGKYGNRLPNLTFEVVTKGSSNTLSLHKVTNGDRAAIDPVTGYLWAAAHVYDFSDHFDGVPVGFVVTVTDPALEVLVNVWTLTGGSPRGIAYNPIMKEMWVMNEWPLLGNDYPWGWKFSTVTNSLLGLIGNNNSVFKGSAVHWPGNVAYDPYYAFGPSMDVWGSNGVGQGFGWALTPQGPEYPLLYNQIPGPDQTLGSASFWVLDIAPSDDASCYLMQNYGGVLQLHTRGVLMPTINPTSDNECLVSWDNSRHLFWVLVPSIKTLYTLSPDNVFTLVATLPFLNHAISDVGNSFPTAIAYDGQRDSLWITTQGYASQGDLLELEASITNPVLLQTIAGRGPQHIGGIGNRLKRVPGYNKLIAWGATVTIIPFGSDLIAQKVLLKDIVADISTRVGLSPSQTDESQLTDLVDGFCVANSMAGRSAIEPLAHSYFFESVESDGKVKFIKRGGPLVVSVPSTSALLGN